MITIDGLTKTYGSVTALRSLSLSVEDGSILAFLGRNGAGKTTAISCMVTILDFESGSITINGREVGDDDDEIRHDIGVVFQDSLLDELLTPVENLRLRAGLYGIDGESRIRDLCVLLGLDAYAERRYGRLSGGEKRRVDIARALLHSPSVLFLDEPTAGLDPQSRARLWQVVDDLREREGLTVFLTTHYMEETERADDVIIIDGGEIVAQGSPRDLRAAHSRSILTLKTAEPEATLAALRASGRNVSAAADALKLEVAGSAMRSR